MVNGETESMMGIAGAPISSSEVIQRAQYWMTNPPPGGYNQGGDWKSPEGTNYRTDCSGYVSMSWHLPSSPNTTALLSPVWTIPVEKGSLQSGDILCAPAGNGMSSGHAVLFVRWVDTTKQDSYIGDEFGHGAAPITRTIPYPYDPGDPRHFTPRRYTKLIPSTVKGDGSASTPNADSSQPSTSTHSAPLFATAGFAVAGVIAIIIIALMIKF